MSGDEKPVMPQTPPNYFRADIILIATTFCVCILVAAVLLTLNTESALNRESARNLVETRAARDVAITLNHAVENAYAARRAHLISADPTAAANYDASVEEIRGLTGTLYDMAAVSVATAQAGQHLRDTTEIYLSRLNTVTLSQLRTSLLEPTAAERDEVGHAVDRLRASFGARYDAAREREAAVRARVDLIGIALAILAFAAPVLAILAVQRERRLWRRATALAEAARQQATEADLAKSRFLAVASHDMRQPLHALSLYISALERRVETPEARDILTKMDRATQSLVGMFSKLLDLARVQAGAVKLEIAATPLQDVIDRVAAEHPESTVAFARSTAIVKTDAILLERLLGNLVVNALKHGGGKARIEVSERADVIDVSVADDGPGIPQEDQERVFGEFVRLGRKSDGLGLGLSIVRRIADLLDVSLELQSQPGRGTRFTVSLPRAFAGDKKTRDACDGNGVAGKPVLVVDDDATALDAMCRVLADLGADVRCATREADAQTFLDAGFAPRLIIMDLRIDGELAGVDIARRLRQQLSFAPPVIVVTGDTAPETLAVLQLSGFIWLIKPVNPSDIEEAAAALLSST